MSDLDVARGTALILHTDGSRETVSLTPEVLEQLRKAIGAESLDFVNVGRALKGDRRDLVMVIDDRGYETETIDHGHRIELRPLRALKPINGAATRLYHAICVPGTTHQIAGDAAVFHDEDV